MYLIHGTAVSTFQLHSCKEKQQYHWLIGAFLSACDSLITSLLLQSFLNLCSNSHLFNFPLVTAVTISAHTAMYTTFEASGLGKEQRL